MIDFKGSINRRDFLRGAAYTGLAAAMGLSSDFCWATTETKKTRVVLIRNSDVIDTSGNIDSRILGEMLDRAVVKLTDKASPLEAWRQLISPSDTLGIKSNEWGPLPTPPELEQAIKDRALDIGIPAENIDIDDRNVLYSDVFLNSTALINVRPLRTHHWSGIGGCLKNYIMFVPKPHEYHDDSCADLAALWDLPLVKGKTRLNVLAVLTPQFHNIGAHHFDKKYIWQYKGLLVGNDPVAVDAVGVHLLEAKRGLYFKEDKPILPPPHHVVYGEIRHKLGVCNPAKIELVRLGWQEDVLI
ncbi:MAG: DUF362 domain-containing protein [candidate division Zixibacteria bacterium]|nr:DUF362 domain-containing protein [candidate division Zixibacteria bacterium]